MRTFARSIPTRSRRALLGAAALATAGAGLFAAPAQAAIEITCGARVTGEVYLTTDLDCANLGITVTGDATVDLGGHTLSGRASTTRSSGIVVAGNGTVRIQNGHLTDWSAGVVSSDEEDDGDVVGTFVIDRVSFADNDTGVEADAPGFSSSRSRNASVQRSRFTGNGSGVSSAWAQIDVQTSYFAGNTTAARANTARLHLQTSVLTGNQSGVYCDESSCVLERNVLRNNPTGVATAWGGTATLTDNTVIGSNVGVSHSSFWEGSRLSGNHFIRNRKAVGLAQGSSVTATGNSFTENTSTITSSVTAPDGETTATLTGNTFTRNGDGINLLIQVGLKDNSAVDNTGWGIYAPNATDLGGNTAHGNGKSPQCTGVVCR